MFVHYIPTISRGHEGASALLKMVVAEATGNCESLVVGAGNQTCFFLKTGSHYTAQGALGVYTASTFQVWHQRDASVRQASRSDSRSSLHRTCYIYRCVSKTFNKGWILKYLLKGGQQRQPTQ